ncbi:RES domain-containing protein [Motilibacter rhizosphaerae]|uniref:RES domain-containing protein n=1 Tax=Motilibacter rhizosphaerae TaxID=598652 RepID=A0A4Q7NX66_9ACTN|nr:RES family NAD+ phosphorylase [Motilibacter rhizosphaerae]RZS91590.1 RES domain-containing protein [Motilibacter rhizosphaerae]
MTAFDLAARLAELAEVSETGRWQRHSSVRLAARALDGYASDGRWGTKTGFPVLYLVRPTDSVVVEAYRHQVDPLDFDTEQDRQTFIAGLLPRVLVTCEVSVTGLLDLRTATARAASGLAVQDLQCPTYDRAGYQRCQQVAQVAHQLGRHGLIAPAATGLGETLVLFTDLLPQQEKPTRIGEDETWASLPDDPRLPSPRPVLRLVRDSE